MKKILLTVLLAATTMLVGCGEPPKPTTFETTQVNSVKFAEPYLSTKEKVMIQNVWNADTDRDLMQYYDHLLEGILVTRKSFGQAPKPREDNLIPFCDVKSFLQKDINEWRRPSANYLINNQWKNEYGVTLITACEQEVGESIGLTKKLSETQLVEAVTKDKAETKVQDVAKDSILIDDTALLDVPRMRQLTESVKDCERARIKLVGILDANEELTVKHYDDIMKIVIQCERFKLEQAVNGN